MTKLINFLNDYQRPVGNHPKELDLALLSHLVELPFEKAITPDNPTISLVDACSQVIKFIDTNTYMTLPSERQLLKQLIDSNRYSDVSISNIVQGDDHFFAATFNLTPSTQILAFRGLSGTLISWKNDLHFSNSSIERLTDQAQLYLSNAIATGVENIVCIGFSKGASLAALACMDCEPTDTQEISAVLFESPGLPDFDYDFKVPVTEFVAPLSIFALIGEHPFKQVTVDSSTAGIWQHDPYSWISDSDGNFVRTTGIMYPEQKPHLFSTILPQKITAENLDRSIDVMFEIFSQLPHKSNSDLIKHWNQFNNSIQSATDSENIVVKMMTSRIQQTVFQNAVTNLQSIPLK